MFRLLRIICPISCLLNKPCWPQLPSPTLGSMAHPWNPDLVPVLLPERKGWNSHLSSPCETHISLLKMAGLPLTWGTVSNSVGYRCCLLDEVYSYFSIDIRHRGDALLTVITQHVSHGTVHQGAFSWHCLDPTLWFQLVGTTSGQEQPLPESHCDWKWPHWLDLPWLFASPVGWLPRHALSETTDQNGLFSQTTSKGN